MRTEIPFRLVGGEQPLIVVAARFNDVPPVDCALDLMSDDLERIGAAAA